jgi:hypothetical protein
MALKAVAAFGVVAGVNAGSITNCADSSAHLKNFEATISPDPPVKGQPVTMTFKGAMDEDTDKGSVIVGVNAGPIKLPQMKIPFDISPVIPHGGEVNLQVGPFDYPDISVPLLSSITSHFEVHDKADEMVMCVDTTLPAAQEAKFLQAPVLAATPPVVSCSGADAHFKNVDIEFSPAQPQKGDSVTITFKGDLDEGLTGGEVDLDVNFSIASLSMKIPFTQGSTTPATSGIKAVIGPFTLPDIPLIPNVKGTVKVSEQNGEEVLCANFNLPLADAVEV